MVNVPKILPLISQTTGVQKSRVATVARRLGEAGSIPRGLRGKTPPEIGATDVAQILIGLMYITDGLGGAVARVVGAVDQIGKLNCTGRLTLAENDSPGNPSSSFNVVSGGPFLDQLVRLMDQCQDRRAPKHLKFFVSAVGLTFHSRGTCAWVETTGRGRTIDKSAIKCNSYDRRAIFGNCPESRAVGMTREATLGIDAIIELGKVLSGEVPL